MEHLKKTQIIKKQDKHNQKGDLIVGTQIKSFFEDWIHPFYINIKTRCISPQTAKYNQARDLVCAWVGCNSLYRPASLMTSSENSWGSP